MSNDKWSPDFWAYGKAIVQWLAEVVEHRAGDRKWREHSRRAELVAHATARARRSFQAGYHNYLHDSIFHDDIASIIGRRLPHFFPAGWCGPPPDMEQRWARLRGRLSRQNPAAAWPVLKTLAGGWTTRERMHLFGPRPCIFGCQAADSQYHYLHGCSRMEGALRAGSEHWRGEGLLARLGLHAPEVKASDRQIDLAIYDINVAYHIYNEAKEFDSIGASQLERIARAGRAAATRSCSLAPPAPRR